MMIAITPTQPTQVQAPCEAKALDQTGLCFAAMFEGAPEVVPDAIADGTGESEPQQESDPQQDQTTEPLVDVDTPEGAEADVVLTLPIDTTQDEPAEELVPPDPRAALTAQTADPAVLPTASMPKDAPTAPIEVALSSTRPEQVVPSESAPRQETSLPRDAASESPPPAAAPDHRRLAAKPAGADPNPGSNEAQRAPRDARVDTQSPPNAAPPPAAQPASPPPASAMTSAKLAPMEVATAALSSDPAAPALDHDTAWPAGPAPLASSSASTAAVPAIPVVTPGAGPRAFANQLTALATRNTDGTTEIQLSPAELGRVRMTLSPSENGMQVVILTERPETGDLIRRHAEQLLDAFKDAGMSGATLSFGDYGGQGQQSDPEPESVWHGTGGHAPADGSVTIRLSEQGIPSDSLDLRL